MSGQTATPRYRPVIFWAFLLAVGVSVLGDGVASLGVILHAADLGQARGRAWYVTEAELAALLPAIVAAPWLGRLADAWDPLATWRASLAVEAAIFAALPLTVGRFHAMIGLLACAHAVAVLSGAAAFKVLPRYAGRKRLHQASSRWVGMNALALLPSAPVGGLLYALWGIRDLLWANAASFLAVLVVLVLAPPPFPAAESGEAERQEATGSRDAESGGVSAAGASGENRGSVLRYLRTHPVLGVLIVPVGFVAFATSIEAVASVFFLRDLSSNDLLFGLSLACWSLGMVPGSQLGGRLVRRRDEDAEGARSGIGPFRRTYAPRELTLVSGMVMGLMLLAEGLAPSIHWVMVLFLVGGVANGVNNVGLRIAVYTHVPERMQGRAWTLVGVLTRTAAVLGMVVGTPNALYGAQAAIVGAGALAFLGSAVGMLTVWRARRVPAPGMQKGGPGNEPGSRP